MNFHRIGTLIRENWKSGLAVALINIPLSISLAVASLGPASDNAPLIGILTAIYAGAFAAVFASSNFNIFGPAGALSGILLAFVAQVGGEYVPVLSLLTGAIILVIWALRLSRYITLIPGSALHGFLLGVAITIAGTQLNAALGILPKASHETFLANLLQTFSQLGETNFASFGVFAFGFIVLLLMKRFFPKIPGAVVVTVLGILIGWILAPQLHSFGVLTLKDKFPSLEFHLWSLPDFLAVKSGLLDSAEKMRLLLRYAFVIAVIAILETMIAAKIAEKITKERFGRDREIFGLGMANLASGAVGGMPATAVLVRTALNAKSGATHRTSAFLVALFTLLISWLGFSVFTRIPMPIIAAILMNIAVGMVEIELYKNIFKLDRIAFFLTFLVAIITVVDDPIMGIIAGTALALLVFIKKVSEGNVKIGLFRDGKYVGKIRAKEYSHLQKKNDIIIYRFNGSLTYLNMEPQLDRIRELHAPKHVVFSFSNVYNIDLDGVEALEEMFEKVREKSIGISLSGLSKEIVQLMEKTKSYRELHESGAVFSASSLAIRNILEEEFAVA